MPLLDSSFPPLLGKAPAFLDLIEKTSRLAPLDRPVLVVGERGSGKELIATRLHYLSTRWNAPLVRLNAAALPESLIASELFGYEPGAFTGATRRYPGRFERADGGSLFFDEIALAGQAVQEQLLRVIEYGTFERLGGARELKVDVRLIAATNLDLPSEALAGRFRQDLLDRLAFDVLTLPPLRARREDILELAHHFGRGMALELGWHDFAGFAATAEDTLISHHWPGNVRELRNAVERAVYRSADPEIPVREIILDPFQSPYRPRPDSEDRADEAEGWPRDLPGHLAQQERHLLEQALARNQHNQRRAAQDLSLSYDQLRYALRRHDLLPSGGGGKGAGSPR